jgi:hypothetical protein
MAEKPRFQTKVVKYKFGNKPDEEVITYTLNYMAKQGYGLTNRTEKPPGCLGSISSIVFGGGQTTLMFELRDE